MHGVARSLILGALLFISIVTIQAARADIYRYVDEQGVVHFTNMPTHNKFKLFLKERPYRLRKRGDGGLFGDDFFRYDSIIGRACSKYGIDFNLAKAIIKVESNFDYRAVSIRGAMGLMQLMPETARRLGIKDVFDPEQNIEGGVRYLRSLLDHFGGNIPLALAAYNAGKTRVLEHRYRIPPYPETREYVRRVLDYYYSYRRNGLSAQHEVIK